MPSSLTIHNKNIIDIFVVSKLQAEIDAMISTAC